MKKTATRATRARHELLREMLEDRRRDIQQKLRYLREALPAESSDVRDTEEQSLDDFVQEVDFALMQMKSETLRRIDDAIGRLEAGTYGQCSECEEEISAARLKALPFAELCRDCQEAEERRHAEEAELKAIERNARIIEAVLR